MFLDINHVTGESQTNDSLLLGLRRQQLTGRRPGRTERGVRVWISETRLPSVWMIRQPPA